MYYAYSTNLRIYKMSSKRNTRYFFCDSQKPKIAIVLLFLWLCKNHMQCFSDFLLILIFTFISNFIVWLFSISEKKKVLIFLKSSRLNCSWAVLVLWDIIGPLGHWVGLSQTYTMIELFAVKPITNFAKHPVTNVWQSIIIK